MLFEVLLLEAERKRGERDGKRDRERERATEIDVKWREETEKDCSGKGNRGLNSDEIIQHVDLTEQTDREMSSGYRKAVG